MSQRKICVVTTSRAEYGLLYWLMRELQDDPECALQIIASGTHLVPEFGNSVHLIEADGFTIHERVDILFASDTPSAIAKSLGLTTFSFTDALERLAPDIVVVLGDRYEILGVVQAAMMLKIPVAHIHGGEITEGALDDAIRHAITKLSHLHFPVTEVYARRVAQLGEDPARIYNFGAPGLDHITRTKRWSRAELEQNLNIRFGQHNFLVVYHPVTINQDPIAGLPPLLEALTHFENAHVFFSKSNADEGGRRINTMIDQFVAQYPERMWSFSVLGLPRYLSLASQCDAVIGNSSSGLIEIPAVGVPSVNVGDREKGRLMASSVINCAENKSDICGAIEQVLSEKFRATLDPIHQPYGAGNASHHIKEVLKTVDLSGLIRKKFHDVKIEEGELV